MGSSMMRRGEKNFITNHIDYKGQRIQKKSNNFKKLQLRIGKTTMLKYIERETKRTAVQITNQQRDQVNYNSGDRTINGKT